MSYKRHRLSGNSYEVIRLEKLKRENKVINATPKIDNFVIKTATNQGLQENVSAQGMNVKTGLYIANRNI